MDWDDIVYLCLLILSIALGPLIRSIQGAPWKRQWASTIAGLSFCLLVSGIHILHPIFLTLTNAVFVLLFSARYCHLLSLTFSFVYLALFRMSWILGLPMPPSHTNAIQMMLTLKVVSMAFEMHDTWRMKKDPAHKSSNEYKYQHIQPDFMDIFHYAFCHVGVLTGPFYKYRTYWDMVHSPYGDYVKHKVFFMERIKYAPLYAVLYLISDKLFPLKYAESEEIFDRSILYRLWYMTPLFFNFRMRIYTGFILSECQALSAGLGAYPAESKPRPGQGPTDFEALNRITGSKELLQKAEYNYKAVHNIDVHGSEFTPTVREGMHCWNMTVQYWLAIFIHKRVPSKRFRVAITMLTSAFWHGVYPGYYLSLLTVPFVMAAEASMAKALRAGATPKGQAIYDWIGWFFKMQAFSYMGMAFYLLKIDSTLNFWASIYFTGHILVVVFFMLGRCISGQRRSQRDASIPNSHEKKSK